MPESLTSTAKPAGLEAALRRAREMEAAHFEAVLAVRDAEMLRLEALKSDLAPALAAHDRARDFFDLVVVPGEPPRLWIDLLGAVVMAPDPRTYRLTQDLPSGREVLHETRDRAEMAEKIRDYMAHRLVARERQLAGAALARTGKPGYSGKALVAAWLAGATAGALALLAVGIILKKIIF